MPIEQIPVEEEGRREGSRIFTEPLRLDVELTVAGSRRLGSEGQLLLAAGGRPFALTLPVASGRRLRRSGELRSKPRSSVSKQSFDGSRPEIFGCSDLASN